MSKHLHIQKRNASRSGGEKGSAKHQMKVRQSMAYTQKPPSTSGIMRVLSITCESRKERSDGIAIATKSIASCVPFA